MDYGNDKVENLGLEIAPEHNQSNKNHNNKNDARDTSGARPEFWLIIKNSIMKILHLTFIGVV